MSEIMSLICTWIGLAIAVVLVTLALPPFFYVLHM